MNKQVNHIVYAHLLLTAFVAGYFLLKNLPGELMPVNEQQPISDVVQVITLSKNAQTGKLLFMSRCASCHAIHAEIYGPALASFEERGPWSEREQLYKWVRDPDMYMETNTYTREMRRKYGHSMRGSPSLSNEEIDWIVEYINAIGNR